MRYAGCVSYWGISPRVNAWCLLEPVVVRRNGPYITVKVLWWAFFFGGVA